MNKVHQDAVELSKELADFIQDSPSMFHAALTVASKLDQKGFKRLEEDMPWNLEQGKSYYVVRNNSSVIAFKLGLNLDDYHFQLAASHSDSPTFKLKSNPEKTTSTSYIALNTEAYGGMIDSTWMDRPLGLAGRVMVHEGEAIVSKLIHIDKDVALIPHIAPHLNHEANKGYVLNRAVDLRPIIGQTDQQEGLLSLLTDELNCQTDDIMAFDLFLTNRQSPAIWGINNEFISSPKLDDLQCAFTSLKAFLQADNAACVCMYCLFDNEEVGSNTKQGALSTFLVDTVRRINAHLGKTTEELYQALAKSFLISCDNAHAIHPNRPDFYDEDNCCFINQGVVIKEAANQSYTTDAFSRSVFSALCERAQVPCQRFANRSDRAGGSTLGNLSNMQVSLHACDMGLAQLAMHSSYETAGVLDTAYAISALTEFYNTNIVIKGADKVYFK